MRIYKLVGIVLSALLLLVSCTNSDVDKKKYCCPLKLKRA